MKKCFDNIVKLDVNKDTADVQFMFSAEGEKVQLGRGIKARGAVEEWLSAVQHGMIDCL